MMDFATMWPSFIGPTGTVVFLIVALARGWLHTDREFQDRSREADRIEKFYSDEKLEDKATLRDLVAGVAALSKAMEKRQPVDEVVTTTMAAVQKMVAQRYAEEEGERRHGD